ncbi:hypothetical protein GCM10023333_31520 [Ferrimonas pelagia]|uniref:Uncharacterized protein n=1 Tax=Ferrimonas pelagia TaxID=1177826 RepID=A0ABP9F8S3_9GAMM
MTKAPDFMSNIFGELNAATKLLGLQFQAFLSLNHSGGKYDDIEKYAGHVIAQ